MRKKISQLILFMIVIMVGCFVTEMLLQSSPWNCTCVTGEQEAAAACNLNCAGHGGCLFYQVELWDCICDWGDCYCNWIYECEDRSRGYTYGAYDGCPDCGMGI